MLNCIVRKHCNINLICCKIILKFIYITKKILDKKNKAYKFLFIKSIQVFFFICMKIIIIIIIIIYVQLYLG